jgi:hypothetical protein
MYDMVETDLVEGSCNGGQKGQGLLGGQEEGLVAESCDETFGCFDGER